MKVQTQAHGNVAVLVAHGPLVADEVHDLRHAVQSACDMVTKGLVVDMVDVPYLDSAGVELLLEMGGVHLPPHQRPKFAALTETCREALELTDTLLRLDVFDTVENALRGCQQ